MSYCLYVTYTRTDVIDDVSYGEAVEELYRRQDEVGVKRGSFGAPCPAGSSSFEGAMAARAAAQGNARAAAWLESNPSAA